MIPALLAILTCQLAGEVLSRSLGLPLPGPVLGMVLMVAALALSPRLAALVRPVAQGVLADSDWAVLDEAFTRHTDPLNPRKPRDPQFDRLFTRIVLRAPAPLGLGEAEA